jgi:hypothetical protein
MLRSRWVKLVATAALGVSLSGCLAFGSLDRRATSINEGLGDAQNINLLLNLVRASRSEPLYFESLAGVHGSAQEDLRLGVPQFTIGPHQVIAQRQFTNGTNGSNFVDSQTATSFDVGVFNSKDFYAGMMTPLSLDEANLLFSQGYSRELVLYLLIDSLRVTDVTNLKTGQDESTAPTFVLYNDPTRPNYHDTDPSAPVSPTFERFIKEAMVHGLTTEAYAPVAAAAPTTTQAAGSAPGVSVVVVQPAPTKPEGGGEHARLCYDYALATPDAMQDFADEKKAFPDENNRCGATGPVTRAQSSELPVFLHGRKYEITVTFRSIFGIFNYLGALLAEDDAQAVQLRDYGIVNEPVTPAPLLNVVTSGQMDCFAAVDYRGKRYCVPVKGAENTKRIFAILNALLALKTAPGDLPQVQTVRITP